MLSGSDTDESHLHSSASDAGEDDTEMVYDGDSPETVREKCARLTAQDDKVFAITNLFHDVPEIHLAARGDRTQSDAQARSAASVDLLRQDIEVYDAQVFAFCRRYTAVHRQEHKRMSTEYSAQDQERIYAVESTRARWHLILSLSQKTTAGRVISYSEAVVVVASIVATMIESVPRFNGDVVPSMLPVWLGLEIAITMFFLALTTLRIVVAPSLVAVAKSPMTWFDLVSLLPLPIQLIVQQRTLGWLKTVRMLRLVKLLRVFQFVDALAETMRSIASSLVAPFALLSVIIVMFGNLIYWLEGGSVWTPAAAEKFLSTTNYSNEAKIWSMINNTVISDCLCEATAAYLFGQQVCPPQPTKFISAASGMWFAAATFTTVGYGDITPICVWGKIMTSLAIALSTIFIAMPIAIVGASFTETVVDHHNKMMLHKKLKARTIRELRIAARKPSSSSAAGLTGGGKRRGGRKGRSGATRGDSATTNNAGSSSPEDREMQGVRKLTPCEALLRFIASQLRTTHLDFGDEAMRRHTSAAACAASSGTTADAEELESLSGVPPATGEGSSSADAGPSREAERLNFRQLPLFAQFSPQLVDVVDAFLAWLFEYWLMDALEDGRRWAQHTTSTGAEDSMQGFHSSSNPFARRETEMHRSSRQSHRFEEQRESRAKLLAMLKQSTGSLHPMFLLQAVERSPGFCRQVLLPTRVVTEIRGLCSLAEESIAVLDDDRRGHHRRQRRSQQFREEDIVEGRLVLKSDELWIPDVIGRIEVTTSFAGKAMYLIPHAASVEFLTVNDVPLVDVAARQLREQNPFAGPNPSSQLAAAGRDDDGTGTVIYAPLVRQMKIAAALVDAGAASGSHVTPHAPPGTQGAYAAAACLDLTWERTFAVMLREGDVVAFTPDLRTVEGVAIPPSVLLKATHGARGRTDVRPELEVPEAQRAAQRKALLAAWEAKGVRPFVYRVGSSEFDGSA